MLCCMLLASLRHFYPRPPRGGRLRFIFTASYGTVFLSTPSARRATESQNQAAEAALFLSTPSARRATDKATKGVHFYKISIHALREEGDNCRADTSAFYGLISIHALREEGDIGFPSLCRRMSNFYPRPPRGGRRLVVLLSTRIAPFLSTPSARRATRCPPVLMLHRLHFYPRPPRGGRR